LRQGAKPIQGQSGRGLADEVAKLTGAMTDQQAKVDAAEAARKASAEAEARRTETAVGVHQAARRSAFGVRRPSSRRPEVPVTIQIPAAHWHVRFTATGNTDGAV
jgi:hypothetical protein